MSDDGNESDADIAEETPPLPAPDAGEGEGTASAVAVAGGAGRAKKRRGSLTRAPSKAQTKMVHSCIVKVSLRLSFSFIHMRIFWLCVVCLRVSKAAHLEKASTYLSNLSHETKLPTKTNTFITPTAHRPTRRGQLRRTVAHQNPILVIGHRIPRVRPSDHHQRPRRPELHPRPGPQVPQSRHVQLHGGVG